MGVDPLATCANIVPPKSEPSRLAAIEKYVAEFKDQLKGRGVDMLAAESMAVQERLNSYHNASALVELTSPDGGAVGAAIAVGAFVVMIISFAIMFVIILAGWAICSVLALPEYGIRYALAGRKLPLIGRVGNTDIQERVYNMRVMQCSCVMNWIAAIAGFVGVVALVVMAAAMEAEVAFDFSMGAPTAGDWFFLGFANWDSPGIAFDPAPPMIAHNRAGRERLRAIANDETDSFTFLMEWARNHQTSPLCDPGCPND